MSGIVIINTKEGRKIKESLLKLKRFEYSAWWGDYFAFQSSRIKKSGRRHEGRGLGNFERVLDGYSQGYPRNDDICQIEWQQARLPLCLEACFNAGCGRKVHGSDLGQSHHQLHDLPGVKLFCTLRHSRAPTN